MAQGNFRNWDEIACSAGCGRTMYAKNAKRLGGEKYCIPCFEKASTKSTITSIDDLPEFVKRYARMWKNYPKEIIIFFPMPTELTEADVKAIPISKKYVKTQGGGYDDRGHWSIPLSQGQGWHEASDASGKAPEHVAASIRTGTKDLLRQPQVKKDVEYLMKKFNLIPKQDLRRKFGGRVVHGAVVRKHEARTLVLNNRSDKVVWHELGHIITEEITKTEMGVISEGALISSKENARRASPFYESLMTFKITDKESNTLLKFIDGRDFVKEIKHIMDDIDKIENRIPPYDKIPETELPRILGNSKSQLKQFEDYIKYMKNPQEVFADYFTMLQLDRANAISSLPRLYGVWGDVIDSFMRDA